MHTNTITLLGFGAKGGLGGLQLDTPRTDAMTR